MSAILNSYRWAPFVPVATDSSMLSVLLLLSKYRLRNVPVIESGKSNINNFITQSAVVQGLEKCPGRDWFDCISASPISDLGLPFMSADEVRTPITTTYSKFLIWMFGLNLSCFYKIVQVISIRGDELILEAFEKMKNNEIGGLPVVEGPRNKIIGNLSIRDIRFLLLKPQLFTSFR